MLRIFVRFFVLFSICFLWGGAVAAEPENKKNYQEVFTKAFDLGKSEQDKGSSAAKACLSIAKQSRGMCLQGYYHSSILKEIEKNRTLLIRKAPESPAIDADDENKIAWSQSLGWVLHEINQHIVDFEVWPELLRNKTYRRKYWMHFVEGWVFRVTSAAGPQEALKQCVKLFNQKHICLWASGRASFFYRYGLDSTTSPRKEFISGYLYSKGLFEGEKNKEKNEDTKSLDPGLRLAHYVLGGDGLEQALAAKIKSCLEKAHGVECLSVFPSLKKSQ